MGPAGPPEKQELEETREQKCFKCLEHLILIGEIVGGTQLAACPVCGRVYAVGLLFPLSQRRKGRELKWHPFEE